ncbi:MAG: hypothetical protein AB9842_05440 [Bacteroidales bacterium]
MTKLNRSLCGLFLLLSAAVILFGCSKAQTLVKILGTWEMVNVTDVDSETIESWVFDVDDILVINQYNKYTPDSITAHWEGTYEVRVRFYKKYVKVNGFVGGMDYMNGDWEIVKCNKNILILVNDKENGLLIKEFTKKEF